MNAVTDVPAATDAITSTPAVRRTLARRVGRPVGAVVVLAALAIVGNWWLMEGTALESTDNAYVAGDIAVLGPRVDGDIQTIHVVDNQLVHAGDPLISLDPTDAQARLDQATGLAAEAAAAVATARGQVPQSEAAMAQARATGAQAEAEQTRAAAEAGRVGTLSAAGWSSRSSNDVAVADRRKADAAFASAAAQLRAATVGRDVALAQVAQAEAHKVTADAAVRLAAQALRDTVVRAPFDGIAANRAGQLGQHVMPALQLIAVAPLRRELYVLANFKETQLRRMQPGQRATLTPDVDSAAAVEGRVESLAPATGALFSLLPPENATGNFTKVVQRVPVKIVIDPAVAERATWLRAGLSVTAEVDTRGPDARRLGLWGALWKRLGVG